MRNTGLWPISLSCPSRTTYLLGVPLVTWCPEKGTMAKWRAANLAQAKWTYRVCSPLGSCPRAPIIAVKPKKASLGCCRSQTVAAAMVDTINQGELDPLANKTSKQMPKSANKASAPERCPSCDIELIGRTPASVSQHIRRCNAPPFQPDGYACPMCGNKYKTYAGLRQHQRRTHIDEYNKADLDLREKRTQSVRSQYTDGEIKSIAIMEASLPDRSVLMVKEIINNLSSKTGRTFDAIKKLRQKPVYKKYLAEEIKNYDAVNMSLVSCIPDEAPETQPCTMQCPKDRAQSDCPPLPGPPYLVLEPIDVPCNLISSQDVCCALRGIKDMTSSEISNIIHLILNDAPIETVSDALDKYISNIATSCSRKEKLRKKRKQYKPKGNRAKRRSYEYARLQRLYETKPCQAAEQVLFGASATPKDTPAMEEFFDHYKKVFASKDLGWKALKQNKVPEVDISHAISKAEIIANLSELRESAPGHDGIKREHLRAMPINDLYALLNIIWGTKNLPPILKINRTSLIPKSGNLNDVKQWRPITISSRIIRLLSKIIVNRLEGKIQLAHSQRGFVKTDGVMTNNTILQALIRSRRDESKPFIILSIDLAKAFDSVSITSIIDALREKGVDNHTTSFVEIMQSHISTIEKFFKKHGFEVNINKCATLQTMSIPGTKRLVVETRPLLRINNNPVPTLGVSTQLKYLGLRYEYNGAKISSLVNLESMLDRLKKSFLKPWQKLNILHRYLIPRLHHGLQSMDVNRKKLDYVDRCIRNFVKTILHLPKTTPTAYIHAPTKSGGLGIPSLRYHIAAVYLARLERIKVRADSETRKVMMSPAIESLCVKLKRMLGGVDVTAKDNVQRFWSNQLHNSALGSGLKSMTSGISSWIYNPPKFWKGRDYIGAINLRIGLLPTKGAPYMTDTDCRNPSCSGTRETLYHILQRCPITHYDRINRHDNINKTINTALKDKNLNIESVPRFTTTNSTYIPDTIVVHNNKAYIIETTIAYESKNESLNKSHQIKKEKYNRPDLKEAVKRVYNVPEVEIMPFVVGARGCWSTANDVIIKTFHLSPRLRQLVTTASLQWGVSIHRGFMRTVWRRNRQR
ncbi:unnamed protein product [Xylocopa violacea]|uniref:C2H2-type domain-containing protein n=1 Tax=Xylocopa violacea TaxID=135666 RepID=A0ABP1MW69_XYLVO